MPTYTHKTAPFYATSNMNTPQKVYFEIGVESDDNEAKQKFLNYSIFSYEIGKSDYLVITTKLDFPSQYYQIYVVDSISLTMKVDLEYIDVSQQTSTKVGDVYLRLMDCKTGREVEMCALDYETKGFYLESK